MKQISGPFDMMIQVNDNIDGMAMVELGFDHAVEASLKAIIEPTTEGFKAKLQIPKVLNLYPFGTKLCQLAEKAGYTVIGVWRKEQNASSDPPKLVAFAGHQRFENQFVFVDIIVDDLNDAMNSEDMFASVF
jgi:hypothetical protein